MAGSQLSSEMSKQGFAQLSPGDWKADAIKPLYLCIKSKVTDAPVKNHTLNINVVQNQYQVKIKNLDIN